MRLSRGLDGSFLMFGSRIPVVVGGLIGATVLLSVLAAVGRFAGVSLAGETMLLPALVWSGQVWRLVTWVFIDVSPLSLFFTCLVLWWLGRDLVGVWGARGFLRVYLGLAVAAAVLTVVIARALLGARGMMWSYYSAWPVVEAMIIAWALYFPHRQILVYFVLPLGGRNLIALVVGGTLAWALFSEPIGFIPHVLSFTRALPSNPPGFATTCTSTGRSTPRIDSLPSTS